MPTLAPIRQRLRTFLTPDIRDFIVAQSKDVSYNEIPDYGTPHPEPKKYPNHVFAFPQPADEQGLKYTLLYVMKRADQNAYNWEMQDAGVSEPKFLQVKRSYVTLRSEFVSATPAMGATMANVPAGQFSGTFVLADRQQRRSQDKELDTLFVVEDLTYIQKEVMTDIEPDPQSGIASQVTTTLYYRGEIVTGSSTIQALVADPTNVYWSTDANGFGRTGKQLTDNWYAVSYGQILDLDTVWEKESDRLRPDKFYCPKAVSSSTEITANNTPGEPDAPTASSGTSVSVSKVGRIQKTKTITQSGSPQALKSLSLLPDDGYIYPETDELVLHSDVPVVRAYIDTEGKAITFSNFDACNAIKNTKQAVSLETDYMKTVQRFVPEKFILNAATSTVEATETGVTDAPSMPSGVDRKRITVKQKGVVRNTETTEQTGTLQTLYSTDYIPDDGHIYSATEEVIGASTTTGSTIDNMGRVVTISNIDAHHAIQSTKQAVSLKPEYRNSASALAPEKFLTQKGFQSTEVTETGVTGAAPEAAAASMQEQEVTQKGAIRKTRTGNQSGGLTQLTGTDYLADDGKIYATTQEAVSASGAASVGTAVASDGSVTVRTPIDANFTLVERKQALSVEPETRSSGNTFAPEKFISGAAMSSVETTQVGGGAPNVTAGPRQGYDTSLKGVISKAKITTQSGNLVPLNGRDYLSDDGHVYSSTQEVILNSAGSSGGETITGEGRVEVVTPIDATYALRESKQAISVKPETQKSASKMAPEKFIQDYRLTSVETTSAGVTGEPPDPIAQPMGSATVSQKGAIKRSKTTTQGGELIPLRGSDYMPDDGTVYPTTQEAIPASSAVTGTSSVRSDGTVDVVTPVDANYSIKETKQAISLEDDIMTESDKLAPPRFFKDKGVSVTETTAAGGASPIGAAADFQAKSIRTKGSITRTKTSIQTGETFALKGTNFDPRTGETFAEDQELVRADAVAPSAVGPDGTVDLYEPIDANWSVKTRRHLVSTLSRSWTEVINYEWPPVLESLTFKTWIGKNNRGSVVYPVTKFKQGFTGPQAVQVTQYWSQTEVPVIPQTTMITEGIRYQCPMYSIAIPPCLHIGITLSCTIGSSDPEWDAQSDSEVFNATRYTAWPDTIFWRESKPYMGGFLVHEYTLRKPE